MTNGIKGRQFMFALRGLGVPLFHGEEQGRNVTAASDGLGQASQLRLETPHVAEEMLGPLVNVIYRRAQRRNRLLSSASQNARIEHVAIDRFDHREIRGVHRGRERGNARGPRVWW